MSHSSLDSPERGTSRPRRLDLRPVRLVGAVLLALGTVACTGIESPATAPVEAAEKESPAAALAPQVEAEEAPAETEAPEASEDPQELSNTIRWSTASEVENFGFDVYRGDSADGPFERLNPEVILGGGTVDTPQNYAFEDTTIDPCRSYFYYVESIDLTGQRERFTPVGRAKAKFGDDDPRCRGDG